MAVYYDDSYYDVNITEWVHPHAWFGPLLARPRTATALTSPPTRARRCTSSQPRPCLTPTQPPKTSRCTHMGQKTVDLPKIGPGKTKVIPVDGLKVSSSSYGEVNVVLDASCMLAPVPVDAYWESPYYLAVEKAGALLGGVQPKGQIYFTVRAAALPASYTACSASCHGLPPALPATCTLSDQPQALGRT